ncbi:MAG: undecaprenyl-diphosphate phosphatase [Planctomycetaceae bacterium]
MLESYIKAIILGVVQGIAEFLPISSSGHLVIAEELLKFDTHGNLLFDVMLHLGTLGSILIVYRHEIWKVLNSRKLCLAVVVGTLPAVVVGLSLKDFFERAFDNPLLVGCCLLITAALLIAGQRGERGLNSLDAITLKQAFCIGLFQAFAILPGVSRSGSTIVGGLLLGLERQSAATFSFLLAIPAIAGAGVLTAHDAWQESIATESASGVGLSIDWGPVLAGTFVSFIVGLMALRTLIRLITQRRLHWFAGYCLIAGVATITWQLTIR